MGRDILSIGSSDNGRKKVAGPVHIREILVHKVEGLFRFRKLTTKEQMALVGPNLVLLQDVGHMIDHLFAH